MDHLQFISHAIDILTAAAGGGLEAIQAMGKQDSRSPREL
jgi:hypothetical protein